MNFRKYSFFLFFLLSRLATYFCYFFRVTGCFIVERPFEGLMGVLYQLSVFLYGGSRLNDLIAPGARYNPGADEE
jgi:hypothetical protein